MKPLLTQGPTGTLVTVAEEGRITEVSSAGFTQLQETGYKDMS